ncbi:MAG: bifunctional SulP family inorganic anion transporter/carbonic anhydrase [Planctomycetes bacterium]|nr:bifunctional SulP family inorganic anion transporter/carbonic anhydrase [Planctomycetota bacterium]
MPNSHALTPATVARDLTAGLVVFLVALPLCLGVALASMAPGVAAENNVSLFSGVLAGIIGGIVVGLLSGSHTSVSGPAAGLTAVVAAQVALLGSFEAFLLALVIGGVIQIGFGLARAGFLAAFFPSSVIKGLLAAIGVILILKQIPHLFGHDTDPEGDMAFDQPDRENTFSEFIEMISDLHPGAATIGVLSVAFLLLWDRIKLLKYSNIPAPLIVVLSGVGLALLFETIGGFWKIGPNHLVRVEVANNAEEFIGFLRKPDFSLLSKPAVYLSGLTIAIVASLETLLNLNAVDKIDPYQRVSPPNRELLVQGVGNTLAGLLGGIPITSVIVRSSVNINAGGKTKLAAIFHGVLLLVCVMFLPTYLNQIPLSCLAAILLVTGIKLASPALVRQMWAGGRYQFGPFLVTLVAIVFTDLLIGILIGLAVSISFILYSNLRRPLRRVIEKHIGGEVLRIEFASQVSFLNRAALEKTLRQIPRGGHVLLDARHTDYIDPDVLDLIRDFKDTIAPAHGVQVSLRGFRDKYQLQDDIQFVDYSTRELREKMTPAQVLEILLEGNERFRTGRQIARDSDRSRGATARGQHPIAVILSCIDSRSPAELIFDLGLGDIFSVRVAGNVISPKVLGSMEYSCAVAGAKLILIMGHTQCGAVTASVNLTCSAKSAEQATGCQHLEPIIQDIQHSIDPTICQRLDQFSDGDREAFIDAVARRNVQHALKQVIEQSYAIARLIREGKIAVVGALYDVASGQIELLSDEPVSGSLPQPVSARLAE